MWPHSMRDCRISSSVYTGSSLHLYFTCVCEPIATTLRMVVSLWRDSKAKPVAYIKIMRAKIQPKSGSIRMANGECPANFTEPRRAGMIFYHLSRSRSHDRRNCITKRFMRRAFWLLIVWWQFGIWTWMANWNLVILRNLFRVQYILNPNNM